MEKDVKSLSWEIGKFYGILVVNDAINTKFNEFKTTKQGLVGTKQGSVEKFNL
ncbi:MAG: hypothetical protein GY861_27350, partial [bacterium]|nr:hypothetical protein [bacterium]